MRQPVCLVCKSFCPQNSALCPYCLEGLRRLREPVTRDLGDYRIRSLFSWRLNGPRGLNWLIRSLKRQNRVFPWYELSLWLSTAFKLPAGDCVFVPVPSSQGEQNHALGLARALGAANGFPVTQALAAVAERSQKRLRREDRLEIRFERAIWDFCKEYTNVVIVDDIVTTGSTIRAAYLALSRPSRCEVWCLMDRRPCGKSRPLL